MNKEQLAAALGVEVTWVRDAITARTLPITWVGRHARFDEDDIAAWLESKKERPDAAPVLGIFGPKKPSSPPPRPTNPPRAPKPPAGPIKPKPPAGPRRAAAA
ncbi:helix-turn-helix domain-containing protein [Micromonospora sp. ATCC 39149]|uniref:helix-turn-helix domain-containing protein n=1 Tax=Micromonospora sp. (strain ATCC 39149 / NRRL 15099 / SCC 1413) TaxID=219305 RepID=UPI0018DDEE03|nr:helix-turn-helix domain-containing protein [Micromonospora sp. ATCC 39149]